MLERLTQVPSWPLLERTAEQAEFVQWRRDRVSVNHCGNRRGDQEPRSEFLKREDAESLTGITQQQVSKWAKRLKDEGTPALKARGCA